jgi:hypothetical protein
MSSILLKRFVISWLICVAGHEAALTPHACSVIEGSVGGLLRFLSGAAGFP